MFASKNLLFFYIAVLSVVLMLLLPFSVVAEQMLMLPGHDETETHKNKEDEVEPIFLPDGLPKDNDSPKSNETSENPFIVPKQDKSDKPIGDNVNGGEGDTAQSDALQNLPLGEKMIALLGNDAYATTYAYLADGNTIRNGYNGKSAKGLQQLVVALGAKVATDGQVGAKTIAAINQLAEGYAKLNDDGSITKVDLTVFEDMLLALLLQADEQTAHSLLKNEPDAEKILALYKAADELQKGNRFTARTMYEALGNFRDSELRAAKTMLPWPKNGQLYRNPDYTAKKCEFKVVVGGEVDTATYIKIYTTDEVLVLTAFIASGSSMRLDLPEGAYRVKTGVGTSWYGVEEAFGYDNDAQYSHLSLENGSDTLTLRAGYAYTLSLSVREDKDGEGVEMAPETWMDF